MGKRVALVLVGILMAAATVGFVYERGMAAEDARRSPAPGRLVEVDGQLMHLNCTGAGSPTLVLDAGLGGWSLDWSSVQTELARSTRVCSYDRRGMGWSSPGPEPADAQHAVSLLRGLLVNAGIDGPLVLVGHSNGGLRMLLYAAEFRDDVVGMVLVDPTPIATTDEAVGFLSPSEQTELLSLSSALRSDGGDAGQRMLRLIQIAQPFGIARLLTDGLLEDSPYTHLNVEAQPGYRAGMNRASFIGVLLAETEQRQTSIDQVRQMGPLGDMPLVVLASSTPSAFQADPVSSEMTGRLSELALKTLDASRLAVAQLSSTGRLEPVERSGHYIQFDRPDAVILALQGMIGAVKN